MQGPTFCIFPSRDWGQSLVMEIMMLQSMNSNHKTCFKIGQLWKITVGRLIRIVGMRTITVPNSVAYFSKWRDQEIFFFLLLLSCLSLLRWPHRFTYFESVPILETTDISISRPKIALIVNDTGV